MNILITDKDKIKNPKKEFYLGKKFNVTSLGGLNPTEQRLIDVLPTLTDTKKILIIGNRTGVIGMIAQNLFPDAEVNFHCIDLYHAASINRNLVRNSIKKVKVLCEPYINKANEINIILIQISKSSMQKELICDYVQQIHQALVKGGKCYVSLEDDAKFIEGQFKKSFGNLSIDNSDKHCPVLTVKKKDDLENLKNYETEFEMSIPNKEPFKLITIPGVFAHRRVDPGAQALAEVVEAVEGDKVVDMGCGCGSIGISIAKYNNIEHVAFIDSDSRAIYSTELNCKNNGIENYKTILSTDGFPAKNEYTLFVGNPPYYSNYKISELFIKQAHKCLKPKARAYIVAKTADWHYDFMLQLFGNAEIIKRRGYQIVKSVK